MSYYFIFYCFINENCSKYQGVLKSNKRKVRIICDTDNETCQSKKILTPDEIIYMSNYGFEYKGVYPNPVKEARNIIK